MVSTYCKYGVNCANSRFNNAGVAGEGSREGYEASEDPSKFSQQLLKSEYSEWSRILETNVTGLYVSLPAIQLIVVHLCGFPTLA